MAERLVERLNEYYGVGECRATCDQVRGGTHRVEFPGGEPGVRMAQAAIELIRAESNLEVVEREGATGMIVRTVD